MDTSRILFLLLAITPFMWGCGLDAGKPSQSGNANGNKSLSDQEKIQGKWKCSHFEIDGHPEADKIGEEWSFEGDKVQLPVAPKQHLEMRFTLSPEKNPKEIDASPVEEQQFPMGIVGIYKLDGGTMTLCYSPPRNDTPRPNEFATADLGVNRQRRALVILERDADK